jgi:cytoplasmic tRNA 2-thiolation protein 2
MRDRTNEVRAMVEQYKGFEFVPFRIENAFDPSWWELVGGSPIRQNLGVDVTNEGQFFLHSRCDNQ